MCYLQSNSLLILKMFFHTNLIVSQQYSFTVKRWLFDLSLFLDCGRPR